MLNNIILNTDSYKTAHWQMTPPNTEKVYSYFESRGGRWKDVVFFGLQYYLNNYLDGNRVCRWMIDQAEKLLAKHFNNPKIFNKQGWEYILNEHKGWLPVSIKAVPEGSVVPNHNVLMTIENTDPKCYWLTNYLETLLVQTWYPTTVCTQSREMKKIILNNLEETGDPSLVDFKLHDFGARGVSSVESAGVGGAAHLVSFLGTDTMAAFMVAHDYYDCLMAGFSIPAAEHSTITSWGKDHEVDAFRNMLDQFPEGLVAVVSDSFDIYRACKQYWGKDLKEKVLNRNGTLIVRPDSGAPTLVVPAVLDILGEAFGYETNAKGFKVLNPHIRVIQGDGVDFDTLEAILDAIKKRGWSGDNLAFGSGGGLLQKLNRDTLKFAFKCASVTVNGVERDVYKQPVTDQGKMSKAGRMKLIKVDGNYKTVNVKEPGEDLLVEVFRDGRILKEWTFDEVRERAKIS